MQTIQRPVIIIGAGIAGLAAAYKLMQAKIPVIVLEAADRLGGRILTDQSLGLPISLGAQWLHGLKNNPVAKLADGLGLHYKLQEFSNLLMFDKKYQPIPKEISTSFFAAMDSIVGLTEHYACKQPQDISLLAASQGIRSTLQLDPVTHDLFDTLQHFWGLYHNTDIEQLSGRYWNQEESLPGGNHLLIDGFAPIVNQLAKKCDIRFNTKVTDICLTKNDIVVHTTQGKFETEKAIITVSLGVLKRNAIRFEPELPANKQAALAKLDMGVLNSLVLKFPHAFWPKKVTGLFFSAPTCTFQAFVNLQHFQQQPIMTARIAGKKALALEEQTDAVWLDLVMKDLQNAFGSSIPNPSAYLTTRWGQNPLTYGSYSYIPVGATSEDFLTLSQSIEDRLFFAGEATMRQYPGTVHGAYLSGIREAVRLMN